MLLAVASSEHIVSSCTGCCCLGLLADTTPSEQFDANGHNMNATFDSSIIAERLCAGLCVA